MRVSATKVAVCLAAGTLGCSGRTVELDPYDGGGDAADSSDAPDDAAEVATPPAPLTLTWTAVNANIVEGDITSIWGTGADDVYVGTDMGAIYHLSDGIPSGKQLSTSTVVGAGWGADRENVYAAGASGWLAQAGLASAGGLYRLGLDGSWASTAAGTFYSVWGSSSGDVYAAGPAGVVHSVAGGPFNGEATDAGSFLSLWGSASDDVYATSAGPAGAIFHSSGDGAWQPISMPITGQPWAIWSSAPGDVYAIVSPAVSTAPSAYVLHSTADGGWTQEAVDTTFTTLVTLWGSGPQDVYAGGWQKGASGKTGVLYHSTGDGTWTGVPLPGRLYDLRAVWGSSAVDVYVGVFDIDDGPVLLHGQP